VSEVRCERRDVLQGRSKCGGRHLSDARKLKALEDENRRVKNLLAESMLDAATLKEMLRKNI
jgi:putative transposase